MSTLESPCETGWKASGVIGVWAMLLMDYTGLHLRPSYILRMQAAWRVGWRCGARVGRTAAGIVMVKAIPACRDAYSLASSQLLSSRRLYLIQTFDAL